MDIRQIVIIYLVAINVATFFTYGIGFSWLKILAELTAC